MGTTKRRRYRYRSRAEAEDAQEQADRDLTLHRLALYDLATGATRWLESEGHRLGVSRLTGAAGGLVLWMERTETGEVNHGVWYLDDLERDLRRRVYHGIQSLYPPLTLAEKAKRMRSQEMDGGSASETDGGSGSHRCPGTDDDDRPLKPQRTTCNTCGKSWCERCDPCPSALCHYCHGRGHSTAEMDGGSR